MGRSRRIDLCAVADVPAGTMQMAWVDGSEPVLVANVEGEIRAVSGVCTHEYFELDTGFLQGRTVTCMLHLSRFDLFSGKPLDPPADARLAVYPVAIEDGRVVIDYPG
jgi:3-phenylpropionate/trans-cinnamate dioxygenase ferredoxin component